MFPLILFVDCEVQYDGRASSTLMRGNYLIIIKPDGSVLIHGSSLCQPLNYMGAGASITYDNNIITCRRKRETIIITLFNPNGYTIDPIDWSSHKIVLVKTEAELRDKLVHDLPNYIPGYDFVYIKPEEQTQVGPCDILAVDSKQGRHIIEIKRHRISVSSVVQVRKYIEALAHTTDPSIKIIGYVAAPSIIKSALTYCERHNIIYIKVDF